MTTNLNTANQKYTTNKQFEGLYEDMASTLSISKDKLNFKTAHLYLDDYVVGQANKREVPAFPEQVLEDQRIKNYYKTFEYEGEYGKAIQLQESSHTTFSIMSWQRCMGRYNLSNETSTILTTKIWNTLSLLEMKIYWLHQTECSELIHKIHQNLETIWGLSSMIRKVSITSRLLKMEIQYDLQELVMAFWVLKHSVILYINNFILEMLKSTEEVRKIQQRMHTLYIVLTKNISKQRILSLMLLKLHQSLLQLSQL